MHAADSCAQLPAPAWPRWRRTSDLNPNQRYRDASVQVLDPSFTIYRIYSSTLEQVATGMRWAEGPVYFADDGYLLVSDIPNNHIMKYSEQDGSFTVFRDKANGNTQDRQGRLLTCEHSVTRRVTRTEKEGKLTVLADGFEGKKLNAPNDIIVKSDDSIYSMPVRAQQRAITNNLRIVIGSTGDDT